jgi:hypothetical protein
VKSLRRLATADPATSAPSAKRSARRRASERRRAHRSRKARQLDEDEANLWALEELTRLRENASDSEVLKLLLRRAELTDGLELAGSSTPPPKSPPEARRCRARGELYETTFENT